MRVDQGNLFQFVGIKKISGPQAGQQSYTLALLNRPGVVKRA